MSQKNKKQQKTFQIYWPKWQKKKGIKETNKVNSAKILVSGLLLTCIVLSIASGFVDIVFFSGLSKSQFHLGTLALPAAILYTIISLGLISMKFWCAMKIGMLRELRTRLKAQNINWWNNISRSLLPWNIAHKLLIALSLITAMSMSVNSIGAGIREIQRNVDNMGKDAQTLIDLSNTRNEGKVNSNKSAISAAESKAKTNENLENEVSDAYSKLLSYQDKARDVREKFDNGDIDETELNKQLDSIGKQATRSVPVVTSKNWEYATRKTLYDGMAIRNTVTVDNSGAYKEIAQYSQEQINLEIISLIEKEYRKPNGDLIIFTKEDGSAVEVQTAISRLQAAISDWQNDTGDVGESSKVFTLIATYLKADEKAGGMGASEWMIMILIFVVGIIQEFAIALCTPAATISRETLSSISNYCEWKDEEEKERFLLKVYKNYVGNGVFSKEDYINKCKKSVELMEDTVEDIIAQYSKKNKIKKENTVIEKIIEPQQPKLDLEAKIKSIDSLLENENRDNQSAVPTR